MSDLDSKTIVVTGGSLGIGKAVALECARRGARVIIVARNETDLHSAEKELTAAASLDHRSYKLDVSDAEAVAEFARWIESEFKEVQGLVNCAGIYGPIGKTSLISMDEFARAVEINFLGTVYMCNALAHLMSARTRKKIVNFSGGGAAAPFPRYSAYASSKAAIVRFTENLSLELADEGCDVNCVAPGFVITRLHQQTLQAGAESAGADFLENTRTQMQRGGVPLDKPARLTAFLLSEPSDGITGKFISAAWDPWEDSAFQQRLREEVDFATLRRIDGKTFRKIS